MAALMATNMPVFVVIVPLFVAFILPTLAKRESLVENLVILVELSGLALAAYLAVLLFNAKAPLTYALGGWPAPWGIQLIADHLAVFFLLVVAAVSLPIALYAKGGIVDEVGGKGRRARFFVLYLLLNGSLAGMAVTNDLFNVFVLVEVATLSCCGLVAARNLPQAAEAAFTYLILATLGSGFVLGGIGFLYITTGHLNMGFAAAKLSTVWQNCPHVLWIAASFMLVGFGVKSALFPLHVWLPNAHSIAPTPASAILSGLAVKGYLVCLLKVLYTVFGRALLSEFAVQKVLTLAGMAAILAGSALALQQEELKRRLAFSTVAQVGYLVLGFGFLNERGLTGALFHLASHAAIKASLFLAAGAMQEASGKKHLRELAGIGQAMPITTAVFTIGSLGLVGIPLFSGFVGKWHLLLGSLQAQNIAAVLVIIAGSVLCAAYLFPVIRIAYFEPAKGTGCKDPPWAQKTALLLLATAVITLGVLPGPLLGLARQAAAELLRLP